MKLRSSASVLGTLAVLLTARAVSAQNAAAPAPASDDDLEVPAGPGAQAPTEPAMNNVPAPAPVEAPAASGSPEKTKAPTPAAPAAARQSPPATRPAATQAPRTAPRAGLANANLERVAYGRPVPKELTLSGYIQGQYEANAISEDQLQQGDKPLNQDRFVVRRARLRLDRGWDYAAATLELDANTVRGPKVGIRRAEGSLLYRGNDSDRVPPLVMLSLGVTDLPFGFELAESARGRPFMERSLASSALFPTEMDVGAKLSGAVAFLRYGVAISNGEPVNDSGFSSDPNAAKDVTGRVGADLQIVENLGLSGGTSFAVGKGFHAGQPATKDSVVWRDANENRQVDPGEIIALPGTAETKSENFDRWAFGLDLGVRVKTAIGLSRVYGEVYVASNYDRGFLPADPVTTGVDVREAGGYAALVQEITPYGLAGFRYAVYDPNSDVIETRATKLVPKTQTVSTYSLLAGAVLPDRARLTFEYDFIHDYLARDSVGVPTDADNNQWTLRLEVEL